MNNDKTFVRHEQCEKCGSTDGVGVWSDGQRHCFVCEDHKSPKQGKQEEEGYTEVTPRVVSGSLIPGVVRELKSRGLTRETCEFMGLLTGEHRGQKVMLANYCDEDGNVIAQKVRTQTKEFSIVGNAKEMTLWGKHLWKGFPRNGRILVSEGEPDAGALYQAVPNVAVVSVPNGASAAKKAFIKELSWLNEFAEVIICFDMDDAGRKAAQECAQLLAPGKAKIAEYPLKDANDMLKAGRQAELFKAVISAKQFKPQGIVTLDDIWEELLAPTVVGLPWWDARLTKLTYGRRKGEIYMFGAGTGVGKTDWFAQQIVHDITVLNEKVAVFSLEQKPKETAQRLIGKYSGKRFHVPDGSWTREEFVAAAAEFRDRKMLHMYDNFGANEWDAVESTIRYLAHAEGIKLFYLDHLTAFAAAEKDEREGLERIMARMGSLVKELDIIIHCISHLATPEGKPHEEGGRVMIRHFKGSRAIGFWSHYMFGLERDQQHEDDDVRTTTTFRVLKDRYTGEATGATIHYGYDHLVGALVERGAPEKQQQQSKPNPFASHGANNDF